MSMKDSSNTIGNRTRDLPGYRAVPQPLRTCSLSVDQYVFHFNGGIYRSVMTSVTGAGTGVLVRGTGE
jgi:hypothetical protein